MKRKCLVVSRLRCYEDYNMAVRLQEEEYNRHYESNRGQRRQVRNDGQHSRSEQQIEDQLAAQLRMQLNTQLTENDEAIARRLQDEFEREDELRKEFQARQDEELARRLQLEHDAAEQQNQTVQATESDEQLARRLQMIENRRPHRTVVFADEIAAAQVIFSPH
ncbi:unnamed protein product [Gongylonema pulchrum]|uniref:Coiled-coil domain-containing protein n=1 Tax=Gongylonema pulchrum TaxID=637853 RepID=A0A3P7PSY8_9BILA|nr:unnamed protein product [Gongylonema pulchrum]